MTLTIGIDVGGTHTDSVLISQDKVHKKVKIPTDHANLLNSTIQALEKIYDPVFCKDLKRVCISTTLSTNAIVEEKYDRVGLLIFPGPGLSPANLPFYESSKVLNGYIDHRGKIIEDVEESQVKKAVKEFMDDGIEYLSVVGKFSNRNPELEKKAERIIKDGFPKLKYISLGHKVSGRLNFPRRISTCYFNAAIYRKHKQFVESVQESMLKLNINAPAFILKGDGGTLSLEDSKEYSVYTILSGPAASILGKMALTGEHDLAFFLDIGGTTTDIGLMLNGSPVFKAKGTDIGGYKTSVRGLFSEPIGIGGDSSVYVQDNKMIIGPMREGPALAYKGDVLTPTDAAIYLDKKQFEYFEESDRKRIENALNQVAEEMNLSLLETAKEILKVTAKEIGDKILQICDKMSNQPVYTVKEVLKPFKIEAKKIVGIGGPAHLLLPHIANYLDAQYILSPYYEVANAIGAGVARPTTVITIHCDTASKYYVIPELGIKKEAQTNINDIEQVIQIACEAIHDRVRERMGYEDVDLKKETEITYTEEFNVVRDFTTIGKIIELSAQIKPGPVFTLKSIRKNGND